MSDQLLVITRRADDLAYLEPLLPQVGYKASLMLRYDTVADALATTGQVSFILVEDHFLSQLPELNSRFPGIPYLVLTDQGPSSAGVLIKSEISAPLLGYAMQCAEKQLRTEMELKVAKEQGGSELDYMRIFDDSPIPMWIYDKETLEFLIVNPAAVRKYGYSQEEFAQMSVMDILVQEELKPSLRAALLKTSFHHRPRQQHRKKNGEEFPSYLRFYPTLYNGHQGFLVAAADMQKEYEQQQKNAELVEDMQKKQQRFTDILSTVSEVLWVTRVDNFDLLYTNDACTKLFGYTPAEMMANKGIFFNAIHPEDLHIFNASIKATLKNESSVTEFRIRHRDGTIKTVIGQAHLKKGQNGEPDILSGLTIDITQIRTAEQALKDKVIQVESILESITDGFYALDKDWRFTYANQEFERIFKCKREYLLGKTVWEVFPHLKAENSEHGGDLRKAMKEQVRISGERFSSAADKWLLVTIYPSPKGATIYIKDISEERKLKETIINAEKKLRAIINNSNEIIWSVNQQHETIESNMAFVARIEKITGKPWQEILPEDFSPEEIQRWHNFYKRALKGEAFSVVIETPMADHIMYEEVNFTPIPDKDNNITSISCFSRNITEQYSLKAKIAEDERNLRAMIDHTEDMIWSVDPQLRLISANKSFQLAIKELSGSFLEPGQSMVSDNIEKDYLEKWVGYYKRAFSGERFSVVDEKIIDGKIHYGDIKLTPIFNENNEVVSVTCFVRDITDRRRNMVAIQRQNETLREIAWIQSHQVRSHVASILGLCQIFNHENPEDETNTEVLKTIRLTAEELDNLIQEITTRAKVIEGSK